MSAIQTQWNLQESLFQILRASLELKSYVGDPARIYDDVPPKAEFPFIQLGESRIEPLDGVDGGYIHDLRLVVHSRYQGRREIKLIMDQVYALIHDRTLDLSDFNIISLRFIFGDILRRQDQQSYQGIMRFRAVTHPAAIMA